MLSVVFIVFLNSFITFLSISMLDVCSWWHEKTALKIYPFKQSILLKSVKHFMAYIGSVWWKTFLSTPLWNFMEHTRTYKCTTERIMASIGPVLWSSFLAKHVGNFMGDTRSYMTGLLVSWSQCQRKMDSRLQCQLEKGRSVIQGLRICNRARYG